MKVKFSDFGIYNVDAEYLKYLHNVDSEVFYMPEGYERKPFLGLTVGIGSYTYFIPFTSAKPRHLKWQPVSPRHFLIYEDFDKDKIDMDKINPKWICKDLSDVNKIRHILSALIVNKMIPVPDGVYKKVDFSTVKPKGYKRLLEREYKFCLDIQPDILGCVAEVYENQKLTGRIYKHHCNFTVLEKACDDYKPGGDKPDRS